MTKFLRYAAALVLFISVFSIWGAVVRHVYLGGTGLGSLTSSVRNFVELPSLVKQVLVNDDLGPYCRLNTDFKSVNKLGYDVNAIGTFYDEASNTWKVRLYNLKDESVLSEWTIKPEYLEGDKFLGYFGENRFSKNIQFSHLRPFNPVLIDKESVAVTMHGSNNLVAVNKEGVTWQNHDFIFHHGINPDQDGNLWACGAPYDFSGHNAAFTSPGGSFAPYRDDHVIHVDAKTGKTLKSISVSRMLVNNGYAGLVAARLEKDVDPIHLNEVEPIADSSEYWLPGDLMISLRNINTVFIYRPSNDSIVWLKNGPFYGQHDPDIINNHQISIFNNSYILPNKRENLPEDRSVLDIMTGTSSAQCLVYDFDTNQVEPKFKKMMDSLRVITATEGLFHWLPNGDLFVEQENAGKIYVISPTEGLIYQHSFEVENRPGLAHLTNWYRIFDTLD